MPHINALITKAVKHGYVHPRTQGHKVTLLKKESSYRPEAGEQVIFVRYGPYQYFDSIADASAWLDQQAVVDA